MRNVIKNLNKATLAEATNISYSRLRKYASGAINELTPEEREIIYKYLLLLQHKLLFYCFL